MCSVYIVHVTHLYFIIDIFILTLEILCYLMLNRTTNHWINIYCSFFILCSSIQWFRRTINATCWTSWTLLFEKCSLIDISIYNAYNYKGKHCRYKKSWGGRVTYRGNFNWSAPPPNSSLFHNIYMYYIRHVFWFQAIVWLHSLTDWLGPIMELSWKKRNLSLCGTIF